MIIKQKVNECLESYDVAINTGFCYQIQVLDVTESTKSNIDSFVLYHRQDITDNEVILCQVTEDEQLQEVATEEVGNMYLQECMEKQKAKNARTITYSRMAATEYAIEHATDVPEFSGSGNSDCANFVSKCLAAGGIPVDEEGKWYPATTWGNTDTCGVNWMRTGYYQNSQGVYTGVKPYMVNKGYFSEVEESEVNIGTFMYWNQTSHVAIITRYDGTTVKYSEHSNYQKDSTYYVYNPSIHDVSFYAPN